MSQIYKGRPPRLGEVFQLDSDPLYFVTLNTMNRCKVLACDAVHTAFCEYASNGLEYGVGIGRYVIMPDHIHLFVRITNDMTLKRWERGLKRAVSESLFASGIGYDIAAGEKIKSFWQPGFFDHLLRSNESYSEKWEYVRENPVRAGLVGNDDDWPYQGEIVLIDRV